MVPSHYLYQCWLFTCLALSQSPKPNLLDMPMKIIITIYLKNTLLTTKPYAWSENELKAWEPRSSFAARLDRARGVFCPIMLWFNFPLPWWRHQMETFSALLALFEGNTLFTGIVCGLGLNKRLSKQSRRRLFEMPSRSQWRYCNVQNNSHIERTKDLIEPIPTSNDINKTCIWYGIWFITI